MNIANIIKFSVVIIVLFTIGDYFGHKYLEDSVSLDVVGSSYYSNKLIYGTILLSVGLYFFPDFFRVSQFWKVAILTAFVILALQFRYYYNYSLVFNYYVIALHSLILFPLIYYSYKKGYLP